MWMYGGWLDLDHVSPEDLPDNEVWSRLGRVLQLRSKDTVVGKPIPFNALVVSNPV